MGKLWEEKPSEDFSFAIFCKILASVSNTVRMNMLTFIEVCNINVDKS
jgi:hypothetical protein